MIIKSYSTNGLNKTLSKILCEEMQEKWLKIEKIFEKIYSMNSNKIKHFIPNFLDSFILLDVRRKDLVKMAQIKSQIKRIKTNEKSRQRNVSYRSHIATESKKVRLACEKKDVEGAKAALKVALRLIDKSVTAGVYTRNTAARKKSTLNRMVNELSK